MRRINQKHISVQQVLVCKQMLLITFKASGGGWFICLKSEVEQHRGNVRTCEPDFQHLIWIPGTARYIQFGTIYWAPGTSFEAFAYARSFNHQKTPGFCTIFARCWDGGGRKAKQITYSSTFLFKSRLTTESFSSRAPWPLLSLSLLINDQLRIWFII